MGFPGIDWTTHYATQHGPNPFELYINVSNNMLSLLVLWLCGRLDASVVDLFRLMACLWLLVSQLVKV